jgi:hypothetical protein
MKPTLFVALVALAVAVVDFCGWAKWFEARVDVALSALLRVAASQVRAFTAFMVVAALMLGAFAYGIKRLFGYNLLPFDPDDPVKTFWTITAAFPPLTIAGGALLLYVLVKLLAWPKRGIVTTSALVIAAIAVALELAH